jgi:hypothetical protein
MFEIKIMLVLWERKINHDWQLVTKIAATAEKNWNTEQYADYLVEKWLDSHPIELKSAA